MFTLAGFYISPPPPLRNAPTLISLNIFQFQISHIFHTSNFPDISNFVYKYFLSHSRITFLLSFHTLTYFIPLRFTIPTSFSLLYCPAFFPLFSLLFSFGRFSLQCSPWFCTIFPIFPVVPFLLICFTNYPNYRFFYYLSHTSIHHFISLYNFPKVLFHSNFVFSSSPFN